MYKLHQNLLPVGIFQHGGQYQN